VRNARASMPQRVINSKSIYKEKGVNFTVVRKTIVQDLSSRYHNTYKSNEHQPREGELVGTTHIYRWFDRTSAFSKLLCNAVYPASVNPPTASPAPSISLSSPSPLRMPKPARGTGLKIGLAKITAGLNVGLEVMLTDLENEPE
jgi:hypothetical protein